MTLTKDAKTVLYVLYKEYITRRKLGFSKSFSRKFSSAKKIHEEFFAEYLLEYIEDSLRELGRNELLKNLYADNTVWHSTLTDFAIYTMENQTKETLLSLANFIKNFFPH